MKYLSGDILQALKKAVFSAAELWAGVVFMEGDYLWNRTVDWTERGASADT